MLEPESQEESVIEEEPGACTLALHQILLLNAAMCHHLLVSLNTGKIILEVLSLSRILHLVKFHLF